MTTFSDLDLHPTLVQTVADLGYEEPTAIQTATIPLMLAGRDVIGQAQTGTGKTAAFTLPILHNLELGQDYVQGLVVTPTRELALQVARAVHEYGNDLGISVLAIYGGQPYERQIRRLKRGVDVVVGTPGRLLDLMRQNALDLSRLRTLVLDEADEMLSMGFIEDIELILQATPDVRQTALFSATVPQEIRSLAERYMRNPESVAVQRQQMAVEAIEQRYYMVNEQDKTAALTRLFEIEDVSSAIVFARTRLGTAELASELTVRGFPAEALHGDMSQGAREQVLWRFRQGQLTVLVATDVAARGLDIEDISHIFNYDLPQDPEAYVHRIGRTGRAGKSGIAITLLTPKERWRLGRIEGMMKQKIQQRELPTVAEIEQHRENQLLQQVDVWLRRGRCAKEREIVSRLMEAGHDPQEIAAVALKVARAEEKQRPIADVGPVEERIPRGKSRDNGRGRNSNRDSGSKRSRRSHEEGMVRLSLSVGRAQGLRISDVVGTLAHHADIPGATIGKIYLEEQHTLVDVPERYAQQVLAIDGSYKIRRQPVSIERA